MRPDRLCAGVDRNQLLALLPPNGVRVFFGSCPEIYLEEAYRHLQLERFPVARRLGETSLMFEVHPTLREDSIRRMARRIVELVQPLQLT